ncbi:type II secretion system minor pseudopilin GspJ [Rhodanobacter aciditrophus]|uniref:Type II secretion system protein J n=1 Tax=Rhodanobacter aciditrophus TaxID=1623218 RepID=A0ABW4AWI7_9GAMM
MRSVSKGFTLIELLIVLGILGFVGAVSFDMLNSSLQLQNRVGAQGSQLEKITRAVNWVQSDAEQFIQRPIRDGLGEVQPALSIQEGALQWTRSGWNNPLGAMRSRLQRVEYRNTADGLERRFWRVLDRDQTSQPVLQQLEGIQAIRAQVLTASGWQSSWPLETTLPGASVLTEQPIALRIEFKTEALGSFTRLIELPGIPSEAVSGGDL